MKSQVSVSFVPLILMFSVFLISLVSSVDMWSAREQPCFQIKKTVALDFNWITTVNTWYYPLMSRYDIYNLATDLLGGNPDDVEEGAMYYDSCITMTYSSDGTITCNGYNGRTKKYNSTELKPNMQEVQFVPADGKGFSATFYNTLTDNKTFAFNAACSKDGIMAWCVVTSIPELPEETVQEIRSHALSLGFQKEYFTQLRYGDKCQKSVPPPSQEGIGGWKF